MSKLLTTGQMIDRLKVGEKAEGLMKYDENKYTKKMIEVCKNDAHSIMVIKTWEVLEIDGIILGLKWRILPTYVTFEEAMKALKEGKMVYFHHGNTTINANIDLHFSWFAQNYKWSDLLEGKWTVGDKS